MLRQYFHWYYDFVPSGKDLSDFPAGLAAYIMQIFSKGTDGKNRETKDGGLTDKFTYTDLLDNVMIYWVTRTFTSSMRLYTESVDWPCK